MGRGFLNVKMATKRIAVEYLCSNALPVIGTQNWCGFLGRNVFMFRYQKVCHRNDTTDDHRLLATKIGYQKLDNYVASTRFSSPYVIPDLDESAEWIGIIVMDPSNPDIEELPNPISTGK